MNEQTSVAANRDESSANSHAHAYLLPTVKEKLAPIHRRLCNTRSATSLTSAAAMVAPGRSWQNTDRPSRTLLHRKGIQQAREAYPYLRFEEGSAYDQLVAKFSRLPVVISLEVGEQVYVPRDDANTLFDLVGPGWTGDRVQALARLPKNLTFAVFGKMDSHLTALWNYGHIKFWSIPTLTTLLGEARFENISFRHVGRIRALAKSMIASPYIGPVQRMPLIHSERAFWPGSASRTTMGSPPNA